MDNIREIFLLFNKSVRTEIKLLWQNEEIKTYVSLDANDYVSIESLISSIDKPIPLSGTHEINGNLININNNFNTIREALESGMIEAVGLLCYLGYRHAYIHEGRLFLADDLIIIKDLNEYKKQKKEEIRIRKEEERVRALNKIAEDLSGERERINKLEKKKILREILSYELLRHRSEGNYPPVHIGQEHIGYRWQSIRLDNINVSDGIKLYKSLLKKDYNKFITQCGFEYVEGIMSEEDYETMIQIKHGIYTDDNLLKLKDYIHLSGKIKGIDSIVQYSQQDFVINIITDGNIQELIINDRKLIEIVEEIMIKYNPHQGKRVKTIQGKYGFIDGGVIRCNNITLDISSFGNYVTDQGIIKRYENSLKKKLEGINIKELLIRYKKTDIDSNLEEAKRVIFDLMSNSEVESVGHDGSNILVYTKPLYINQFFSEVKYKEDILIGRFKIVLYTQSNDVKIFKDYRLDHGQAPHVFTSGSFCTGDFKDLMYGSLKNRDWKSVIFYSLEHLRTYYSGSPAINITSYLSSQRIINELNELEAEGYPKRKPLSGFSLPKSGGTIKDDVTTEENISGEIIEEF